MQIYDLYFLCFIHMFQTLESVVSVEDKSLYMFGYMEVYPYLALT